jgi:hypothetical protein
MWNGPERIGYRCFLCGNMGICSLIYLSGNNANRSVFKGYSARQILEVRLRDIQQLDAFTEELLATKINSIGNVRYDHSKADSLLRVVNLKALSDAKLAVPGNYGYKRYFLRICL